MGSEDYLLTLISGNDSTRVDESIIVATGLASKNGCQECNIIIHRKFYRNIE
jgi:hypothetical protein